MMKFDNAIDNVRDLSRHISGEEELDLNDNEKENIYDFFIEVVEF